MSPTKKVAIITGGVSGIGKATAERFKKEGCVVVIADLTKGEGIVTMDVRNEDEVKNLIAGTAEKYGRIDTVVNSAGIYSLAQSEITTTDYEDFKTVMETNFNGTFLMTKWALPHLVKTKGAIVNISSALGLIPEKESAIYCSSKAAVIMFTKTTALAYGEKGVRVNVVCPGPIDTPMLHRGFKTPQELQAFIDPIPMRRAGTPKEVANLIWFLASSEASYITGGVYSVDGGQALI